MSTFDEREKSFEKKFAHDEELQFKVSARRNKYIGQWVSQVLADLKDHKISDEEIRKKMDELNEKAKSEFK